MSRATLKMSVDGQTRHILIESDECSCDYCNQKLKPGFDAYICEFDKRVICKECACKKDFACMARLEKYEHTDYKGTITRLKL